MKKKTLIPIPNLSKIEVDVRDGRKDYWMDSVICKLLYINGKLSFDSTNNAYLDESGGFARNIAESMKKGCTYNSQFRSE